MMTHDIYVPDYDVAGSTYTKNTLGNAFTYDGQA